MNKKAPARILVVDDDEDVLFATARVLTHAGYDVLTAQRAEEVVPMVLRTSPDIVLLDVVLEADDGLEVCAALKSVTETRDTFVILMSGVRTASDEQADGLASGADGYIARPVPNRELVARVEAMLRIKRAEDQLRESREHLRQLASHLESAREEERASLARELHDNQGQSLTALMLDMDWIAGRLPPADQQGRERVIEMKHLLERLLESTKTMAMSLRPTVLDDLGLVAALEWHADNFRGVHGIECLVEAEELRLMPQCEVLLFRICQEAMTSMASYKGTTRLHVRQGKEEGQCVLTVHGDGECQSHGDEKGSMAIVGLEERVQPFGGEVAFTASPTGGTTLTIRVPCEPCMTGL